MEELKGLLTKILRERKVYLEHMFSYGDAGKIQLIRKYGQLLHEEYQGEGIFVKGFVPREIFGRLEIKE